MFDCCHVLLVFFVLGRLLSIAEETLAEFLSKATGTAVDWVQMPGMKVLTCSDNSLSRLLLSDLKHRN